MNGTTRRPAPEEREHERRDAAPPRDDAERRSEPDTSDYNLPFTD